jgi:hypothetical protein
MVLGKLKQTWKAMEVTPVWTRLKNVVTNRVLAKLIVAQLLNKFYTIYGTPRFTRGAGIPHWYSARLRAA